MPSDASHTRDSQRRDSNNYDEKSEEKQSRYESAMKGERDDEKDIRFDDVDFDRDANFGEEKKSHDGIDESSRESDNKQSSYKSDI